MANSEKKALGLRLDLELYHLLKAEARERGIAPTTLAGLLLQEALQREGAAEEELDLVLATIERLERELPRRVAAALLEAPPTVPVRPPKRNGMTFEEFLASPGDEEDALEE